MPTVSGIIETALYVKDPQTSAEFYRTLFGFETLLESERLIALDVAGRSVLLLFKEGTTGEPFVTPGGTIPAHPGASPNHFAFSTTAEETPQWKQRLEDLHIAPESEVTWSGGAKSLYFRDPDGNLGELITPGFWRTY